MTVKARPRVSARDFSAVIFVTSVTAYRDCQSLSWITSKWSVTATGLMAVFGECPAFLYKDGNRRNVFCFLCLFLFFYSPSFFSFFFLCR